MNLIFGTENCDFNFGIAPTAAGQKVQVPNIWKRPKYGTYLAFPKLPTEAQGKQWVQHVSSQRLSFLNQCVA